MRKSTYIVCGPVGDNGEPTFWNQHQGWITDQTEATVYDSRIFALPLPEGGTGILEYIAGEIGLFYGPSLIPSFEVTL